MWPDPVSNQQPWCIRTKLYSTKLSSQSYTSLSIACIAFTPNNQMNYRYSMNICWDSLNIRHLPGTTPCDSPCRNKALKEHSLWWRQWNLYIGFYRIKTTGKKDSKVFIEVVLWVMETMGSPPFLTLINIFKISVYTYNIFIWKSIMLIKNKNLSVWWMGKIYLVEALKRSRFFDMNMSLTEREGLGFLILSK